MQARVGIDTGGTFTDVVLYNDEKKIFQVGKVESTPKDPSLGALNGLRKILADNGLVSDDVGYFSHGTTVGTNAILQRKLAKTALVTTDGFQDVLEIGRQRRPEQYNFHTSKLPPIIPRQLRFGVRERLGPEGNIIRSLDEGSVREVAESIKAAGAESCAVCLLFSYVNPIHERQVGSMLRELLPDVSIYLSCDVIPEYREYERSSSVALNASMAPVLANYTHHLAQELLAVGLQCELHLMKSSGGIMPFEVVDRWALQTAVSGPAAGALACKYIAEMIGIKNIIGLDMGGTSTDISLVKEGQLVLTTEGRIGVYPVLVPMIDICTIGAGGGSICWIDVAGAMHVGPQSAGADPGPVCYGRGNQEPTVTDANLCTCRIKGSGTFMGGEMDLNVDGAARAIEAKLGGVLNSDTQQCAQAIIDIVNSNMVRAIRGVTVERGIDVRDYALLAFGGGGALHCADLAAELDIPLVIVPENAGVLSAVGLMVADLRNDYSVTCISSLSQPETLAKIKEAYMELESRALQELREQGVGPETVQFLRTLDLRYSGQSYEINVSYSGDSPEQLRKRFDEAHKQMYWWQDPKRSVEVVNVRLSAISSVSKPEIKPSPFSGKDPVEAYRESRTVYFNNKVKLVQANVYDREALKTGNVVPGPAIIESFDTTIAVPPECWAEMDAYRNVIIHVK